MSQPHTSTCFSVINAMIVVTATATSCMHQDRFENRVRGGWAERGGTGGRAQDGDWGGRAQENGMQARDHTRACYGPARLEACTGYSTGRLAWPTRRSGSATGHLVFSAGGGRSSRRTRARRAGRARAARKARGRTVGRARANSAVTWCPPMKGPGHGGRGPGRIRRREVLRAALLSGCRRANIRLQYPLPGVTLQQRACKHAQHGCQDPQHRWALQVCPRCQDAEGALRCMAPAHPCTQHTHVLRRAPRTFGRALLSATAGAATASDTALPPLESRYARPSDLRVEAEIANRKSQRPVAANAPVRGA
jgi:hypothetical protein